MTSWSTLCRFVEDIRLRGVVSRLKGGTAITGTLTNFINGPNMKFNRRIVKVCNWGGTTECTNTGYNPNMMESSYVENMLWIVIEILNKSQTCAL